MVVGTAVEDDDDAGAETRDSVGVDSFFGWTLERGAGASLSGFVIVAGDGSGIGEGET